MACCNASTLFAERRRRHFSHTSLNTRSTALSQEPLVGVGWMWNRGCSANQAVRPLASAYREASPELKAKIAALLEIETKVEGGTPDNVVRSEEHTSELQSLRHLVCRLLLEKKKKK